MEFSTRLKGMARSADAIDEVHGGLKKAIQLMNSVNLDMSDSSYKAIAVSLKLTKVQMIFLAGDISNMCVTLDNVTNLYRKTERSIQSHKINHRYDGDVCKADNIRYEYKSEIYNSYGEGNYGGDQGHPKKVEDEARLQEFYALIMRNNPDLELDADQLATYLKRLNSEGCGYTAIINTIFVEYEGREEEFEKTFGYPMYYKGKPNYDMMLIDFYSSMDNRDEIGNFDPYRDYQGILKDGFKSTYDYNNDDTGFGSTPADRKVYLESFMEKHGVKVQVENGVDINANNLEKYLSEGKQVTVSVQNGKLLNMDGSEYTGLSSHAMTVTGVTEDGKLIVSSWGGQYMIDPASVNNGASIFYSTVEYQGKIR